MPKVVMAGEGTFSFSEKAEDMLRKMGADPYDISRHDSRLIKAVEFLGAKVSYDGNPFIIEEVVDKYMIVCFNDGYEKLITPENADWISSKKH